MVPLVVTEFTGDDDVGHLCDDFHQLHRELFAFADEGSPIEIESWRARAVCRLRPPYEARQAVVTRQTANSVRRVFFRGEGEIEVTAATLDGMSVGEPLHGPAIVESEFTTVVVDPGASVTRASSGSLIVAPRGAIVHRAPGVQEPLA